MSKRVNVTVMQSTPVTSLILGWVVWLILAACTDLPPSSPEREADEHIPPAPLLTPSVVQPAVTALPTAADLPSTPQPTQIATPAHTPMVEQAQTPDTVFSTPAPEEDLSAETDDGTAIDAAPEPDIVIPMVEAEVDIEPARYHIVVAGDTLYALAIHYGTTVAQLQAANQITGDLIHVGDRLLIADSDSRPADIARVESQPEVAQPVTVAPSPTAIAWRPSILVGNLAAAYSLSLSTERFTLHYSSVTPPAQIPAQIVEHITMSLAYLEEILAVNLNGRFDVHVAGSLFAAPDQLLRGRSFSAQRLLFVLSDGSGNVTDWRYITTHELTHLVTWNTFGPPSSALLSEGIAVYTGMQFVRGEGFLPLEDFCVAYANARPLPNLMHSSFLGHIRDLPTYYAAGCFVEYLIDKYGIGPLGQVYSSGDYSRIYQKNLSTLLLEWQSSLNELDSSHLAFPPSQLVTAVTDLSAAYQQLFANYIGTPDQQRLYQELDTIRLLLLAGEVQQAYIMLAR